MRLQDKVAIVTGAVSGIGKEIARRFATEGARAVFADRNGNAAEATAAELDAPCSASAARAVRPRPRLPVRGEGQAPSAVSPATPAVLPGRVVHDLHRGPPGGADGVHDMGDGSSRCRVEARGG